MAGDRFEVREVAAEELETVKLTNLVPPIRFESGVAEIPDSTVAELREILEGMRDRRNVRLHLVGHADTQPLSPALAAVFGDNEGLSRERAGEVAELLQRTLLLPAEGDLVRMGRRSASPSHRTRRKRAARRTGASRSRSGTTRSSKARRSTRCSSRRSSAGSRSAASETVCRLRYIDGNERRTRVQNLVAPLRFGDEAVEVTPAYIEQIRQAVAQLERPAQRAREIRRLHRRCAAAASATSASTATTSGLSRAQARRVALAVQEALSLPTSCDRQRRPRHGARRSAPTRRRKGRALNRRVEVEFWYDDPLQELPDEPQLCPAPGNELVTRVYDPPWGALPELAHRERRSRRAGRASPGCCAAALADVAGKTNARLRFVGYTRNERLERRTTLVYGDDIGLSAARARRAMESDRGRHAARAAASRVRGARLRALRRRRQRGLHPGRDVARRRASRLRRGRRARRLRRRRHHAADARARAEECVRPEPHAHHRRRQADRRSGPQLRRHPALHGRRAAARRHPVRLRQPRGRPAARRRGRAGDRRRSTVSDDGWAAEPVRFHDVRELLALHRARRSADLRARAVARGRAARRRRVRARRLRRVAAASPACSRRRRAS